MASLILSLHGDALRAISKVLQRHCEGLQQASRLARQRGLISNKLAKSLCQVDIAFNLVRHITEPSARSMMQEIEQQLSLGRAEKKEAEEKAGEEHQHDLEHKLDYCYKEHKLYYGYEDHKKHEHEHEHYLGQLGPEQQHDPELGSEPGHQHSPEQQLDYGYKEHKLYYGYGEHPGQDLERGQRHKQRGPEHQHRLELDYGYGEHEQELERRLEALQTRLDTLLSL